MSVSIFQTKLTVLTRVVKLVDQFALVFCLQGGQAFSITSHPGYVDTQFAFQPGYPAFIDKGYKVTDSAITLDIERATVKRFTRLVVIALAIGV